MHLPDLPVLLDLRLNYGRMMYFEQEGHLFLVGGGFRDYFSGTGDQSTNMVSELMWTRSNGYYWGSKGINTLGICTYIRSNTGFLLFQM